MGDEQHGLVGILPNPEQELLHQRAGLAVERAKGLVHEQNFRIIGERARQCHALHHPAGELFWIGALETLEPDFGQKFACDPCPLCGFDLGNLEPELDILAHREPVEECIGLKDHAAILAGTRDLPIIEIDGA